MSFRNYDASKFDPKPAMELPPEGRHVLRVKEASEETSGRGFQMIKVIFSVEGYNSRVYHYFVDTQYVQAQLDRFFDSFGIKPGDFNLPGWAGKSGRAKIRHEPYNGKTQAKIACFIVKADMSEDDFYGAPPPSGKDFPGDVFAGTNDLPDELDLPF